MADNTTELEVLDEIVDVLGGQSGQYETVVPVLEDIRDLLGGGGGGGGYNPALSVGRADALTGADSTAQWAQRVTAGNGAATVRSVQGASVVWNQLSKNDGVSNTTGLTRTFNANGSVTIDGTSNAKGEFVIGDGVQVYKDHKYLVKGCPAGGSSTTYYMGISVFVIDTGAGGIWTSGSSAISHFKFFVKSEQTFSNVTFYPQLFDLTAMFGSGNEPTTVAEFEQMFPAAYYPYSAPTLKPVRIAGIASTDAQGGELDAIEWTTQTLRAAGSVADELTSDELVTRVGVRTYQSGDESDPTVRTDGTTTYYPLETPTTTPIDPPLPMTYRVQTGGSESIIVPDGEISAAPVLTVAEGESAGELVMDALACIAAPDGPTATANHALGTYLTMGGKLYKVTSAIAVGETITAGTNITETTVMAELIARTA